MVRKYYLIMSNENPEIDMAPENDIFLSTLTAIQAEISNSELSHLLHQSPDKISDAFCKLVDNFIESAECLDYFSTPFGLNMLQQDLSKLVAVYNLLETNYPPIDPVDNITFPADVSIDTVDSKIVKNIVLQWCAVWMSVNNSHCPTAEKLEKLHNCIKRINDLFLLFPNDMPIVQKLCKYQEISGEALMDGIAVTSFYLKLETAIEDLDPKQRKKIHKAFNHIMYKISYFPEDAPDKYKIYYFLVVLDHKLIKLNVHPDPIISDALSMFRMEHIWELFDEDYLKKSDCSINKDRFKSSFKNIGGFIDAWSEKLGSIVFY